MSRNDFGVWYILLPAKDGQPAITHNTKLKVSRSTTVGILLN